MPFLLDTTDFASRNVSTAEAEHKTLYRRKTHRYEEKHYPNFSLNSSIGASGKSATSYSEGGGDRFLLGSGSPFSGRQAGGGTRDAVYGTSRYGSGYPYGSWGSYVNGRPFPFVFWPIPIATNYYGADEYAGYNDTVRPGGNVTTAMIKGDSMTDTYRVIGDYHSVLAALEILGRQCDIAPHANLTLTSFDLSGDSYPKPEQMVQWYRASSFGLSLDTYNNSAALVFDMPSSNDTAPLQLSDDTPLTDTNTTFLQCLNTTIGNSIPLVNPPLLSTKAWGKNPRNVASVAVPLGLGFLLVFIVCCCHCLKHGSCCCCCACCVRERKPAKQKESKSFQPVDEGSSVRSSVTMVNANSVDRVKGY